jgi:hypothetical protein
MILMQKSILFTALPLAAAGLAVVAWRTVAVPMARMLELSEDLSGAQPIRRSEKRPAAIAVRPTNARLHSLRHRFGHFFHHAPGVTAL